MTTDTESLFRQARERLAGAPQEYLGEVVQPKKILGVGRAFRIVPFRRAWRLGVILLDDTSAYEVGEVFRARDAGRRGYTADTARERAAYAEAALRGGVPEGESVHIGWNEFDADALAAGRASNGISFDGGVAMIKWSKSGARMPLDAYLNERVDLACNPPLAAT